MKKILRDNLYLVPPLMVLATFLSHIFEFNYVFMGNFLGYSILTGIVFFYQYWLSGNKYCWFTKLSVISLPVMNVICIIGLFIGWNDYIYIFDLSIIAITVVLTIFLMIKNENKLFE